MPPTALLEAPTELVHRVLRFEHPADRVVADFFREQRALGSRERHMLADGVFALLRKLPLCAISRARQRRPRRDRAPPGAARLARQRRRPARGARRTRARLAGALPAFDLGSAARAAAPQPSRVARRAAAGASRRRVLALGRRASTRRRRSTCASTRSRPTATRSSRGCAPPASTPRRRRIRRSACASTASPRCKSSSVFEQRLVEVQDEGSQLLALLTGARRGEMVVDFCAGAGGKTLALGAQMRNTGRLYAFDVSGPSARGAEAAPGAQRPRERPSGADRPRARRPHQAARRQGRPRARRRAVQRSRHAAPQPRPEVAAVARGASPALAPAQRAILAAAARLVKPGGRLVYATCSRARAENEAVASEFDAGARRRLRPRCPRSRVGARPGRLCRVSGRAATTCDFGPTGTATTASTPRSGNAVDLLANPRHLS